MGPEPRPAQRQSPGAHDDDDGDPRERLFALLLHPKGFLVSMDSYFIQGRQSLNQLRINYQVDIGADLARSLRERAGSITTKLLHDGTSIVIGDSEMITARSWPLDRFLRDCYQSARPLPLELWEPAFFYVAPPAFYARPPPEAIHDRNAEDPLTQRFARRAAADWSRLIQSLPTAAARAIDYRQKVIAHAPSPRGALSPSPPIHGYMQRQLHAISCHWPSASESQILASWSESISTACTANQPLEIASPNQRVIGGSNALHLLASFQPRLHSKRSLEPDLISNWIDA